MEKLIKEKFKESTEKLTKGQTKEIKEMVKKSSAVGGEILAKLAERVEMNIGLNEEQLKTFHRMERVSVVMEKDFEIIKNKFEGAEA